MRKAIATISVAGSLERKLQAIAAARFDGIELFDPDLVSAPFGPEEIAARCADLGLAIDLYQPLRDIVGMAPGVFASRLRYAAAKFDIMNRLGVDRVLVCSPVHRASSPDLDLAAEQLSALGDVAAEHGVLVGFEALCWGTHIDSFAQARAVVEAAGHANAGLVVDTFHILARGEDASALDGLAPDAVVFLQIADAPLMAMDRLQWSRHHRCFPGQGSLDVVDVVAATIESGYRGPLSLEVFSDIVREADPVETAGDAYRSLLFLEEQLRAHWAAAPAGDGRPQVELFDPPAAPAHPRPASATLTVPTDRAAEVADALRALEFEPVSDRPGAWRLGAAGAGLTVDVDRLPNSDGSVAVTGYDLAVDDPAQVVSRAQSLGWPVRQSAGWGAGALVRTPTGVEVRFVADPVAAQTGPALDHVGTLVDAERSDAEVSFYRVLLGLAPGAINEFAEPGGRLRSRVMERDGVPLRMALNIAARGAQVAATGINQLAFSCTDLLERVARMRAAGAPLLDIPAGYYEDVAARLEVAPELLATLQELGLLYDRDDAGGELLHVYTPLLGGRFYLEFLERRGGYTGFGMANTPIRLALQARVAPPW